MFCENIVTLVSTFGLFNMYCSSLFFIYYYYFFLVIDFCSFFLYIKRANRLMNSIMNSIFGLVTCLFPPFFFLHVHQFGLSFFLFFSFSFKWSLYVYFLLVMYAYIVYTQKVANITYIYKKKKKIVQFLQMCITFTNFYVFTI